MISKELIIRGNKTEQIVKYFEAIATKESGTQVKAKPIELKEVRGHGVKEALDFRIESKDWSVELSQDKEIYIGKMTFPEVIVRISSVEERLEDLVYQFRIQFLSAGG